ncbi:MAG: hypothetical protein NT154_30135 [Verrucomicrobia bacterium]|nr:hypothetical protein [Verrucomicrobiota bacterium]
MTIMYINAADNAMRDGSQYPSTAPAGNLRTPEGMIGFDPC